MAEHDERENAFIEHIARVMRTPEPAASDFTVRLMTGVNAEPRGLLPTRGGRSSAGWWRRPRTIQLSFSPLRAIGIAAALAGFAVFAGVALLHRAPWSSRRTLASVTSAAGATARIDTVHLVRFVFMAPSASSVSMVGDFNNWNRTVTPLRRTAPGGPWTVTVSIPQGPHQYAFIVDGTTWTPDPASTTTVRDEFGTLTSVIAVGAS